MNLELVLVQDLAQRNCVIAGNHDKFVIEYWRKEIVTYVFDQGTLMLEGVALAQMVEFMIEVLIDLAAGTIFYQETAEDTKTTHPHHLALNQLVSLLYLSSTRFHEHE